MTAGAFSLTACSESDAPRNSSSTTSTSHAKSALAPTGQTVAFVGDSFSVGVGASAQDNRWTSIICDTFGWTERNVAVSGRGYVAGADDHTDYASQLASLAGDPPAAVIISGGWNDLAQGHTVEDTTQAAKTLLAQAKSNLPKTRVVVIAPLAPASGPPENLKRLSSTIGAAAKQAGVAYIDLGMPATGHSDWISPDGLHPNDTGYASIARMVTAQLQQLRSH